MYPRETGSEGQRELTRELNQILRRLRQYRSEEEWARAVLDGAARFMRQGALFTVREGVLVLRGRINLPLAERFSMPVSSAAAFRAAIESGEPVIALRTATEVGETLGDREAGARAHIVPISNQNRVVALLFAADGEDVDSNALELIAGMASIVLERQANAALHTQIGRHLGTGS